MPFPRVQSPSSINTYKQCPRKYFYRYHAKLPTLPSIHLIRGRAVHSALEKFFDTNIEQIDDANFFFTLKVILYELFKQEWEASRPELESLELTAERLQGYYDETRDMIGNFFEYFTDKTKYFLRFLPVAEAWQAVKPQREMHFQSERHGVQGFMDAIHEEDGKTLILDYKTSRRAKMTPEYELQLGIYALLYEERYRTPDRVGIYFLRENQECILEVEPSMIERAREEVATVHLGTASTDIGDYPKRPGPLCKWSTGQCDYYDYCFLGKLHDVQRPLGEEFFIDIEKD